MSGPKLIELRRMRAAAERQLNHDRCAAFGSEYARLLKEFREWGERLDRMGIATSEQVQPLERVQAGIETLLREGAHHEAARLFGEAVAKVRDAVEKRRDTVQQWIVQWHNHHSQLLRDCESLSAERSSLNAHLAALPAGWPENEKKRIRDLVESALAKSHPPAAPGFPDSAETAAALEKLEASVASSRSAVRQAQQQFDT